MNLPQMSNEEGSNVTMMNTNCEETDGDGENLTVLSDAITFLSHHLDTKTVWQKTKYIWNEWTCKDYNLEVKGKKEIGEVIFKLVLWLLSVSDIVTDALLFWQYFQYPNVLRNRYENGLDYGIYELSYDWRLWRFPVLTLAFIYMPSLNVITTICGPRRAGKLGLIFGILMGTAGGILAAVVHDGPLYVTAWLFIILGSSMIFLGISLYKSHYKRPENIPIKTIDLILFPILLTLSPIIFVLIKLLAVIKPKCQLLKHQSTVGSRAEALLESGPQLGVQLYIVLFRMSSNWNQIFSIFTSALSISISNIEHYVTARSEDFGPMSILKNICLFLPATFFKIVSVSIFFVLFDVVSLAIIGSSCLLFAFGIILMNTCTKWRSKEKDWRNQEWDCCLLSWLILTNLGNTKAAALQRLLSFFYWIIVYTSTFTIFLIFYLNQIDNIDPLRVFHLKITLGLTIILGWLTLVLDVISAIIKFRHCRPIIKNYGPENKKKGFWDGFVLLEGLKYFPHCSTISNIRKIQSHL